MADSGARATAYPIPTPPPPPSPPLASWLRISSTAASANPAEVGPAPSRTSKAGIAFARAHAPSFGGDPARTIVLGHSAGGHLALWAAGEIPGLTHAIGLAPVACLETAFTLALSNYAVSEFLGGAPAAFPDRYAAADPARPTHVPRTLIHGDADDIVPIDLTRRFPAPATRIEIPGADHFAVLDPAQQQCVLTAIGAPLDGPL